MGGGMKNAARDAAVVLASTKFGRDRMMTVVRHQETVREFKSRQIELVGMAVLQLVTWSVSSSEIGILCLCVFFLVATTGRDEARRMRACGRYHQCLRSIEVIGI